MFAAAGPGPVEVGRGPLSVTPGLTLSNDPAALVIKPVTWAA
jgi:hypothetical protein